MGKRLNYIANFYRYIDECDPTNKQKNEIINKYNKIMSVDETYLQQINKFVKDVKFQAIYDITDIDEELDDILEELDDNNNIEEYNQLPDEDIEVIEEEKVELPDEDIEVIEEEKVELPDEDIEVIEEEKVELPDEDIEVIEEEKVELPDEDIEVIEEEKLELPDEDIEVIEEEKVEEEAEIIEEKKVEGKTEIPEEIKVKEQKINKPKKQNRLIAFVRNIFNKKDNKKTINKIENKKSNNKKLTKMNIVESYVKNNYKNNNEIKDFINLIKIREDKETIISELYEYILGTKDKISEEEFLNELHNIFGISKKEEKTFKQEKTKSSNPIKEKISEAEKQKRQRISEVNKKYLNIKNELFNELDEYEKAFVEDMHSEGLKPGDAELDQMFNERTVNKAKIYKYLLEIEKNKILYTYEKSNASLDEYEKVFIEDMYSNNIKITDPEFNQMIFERCVDKDSIINYFKELNNINNIDLVKSNENIKLIIEDYKKHINFESSIDLKEKKVNELKQIAKERKLEKFSKMNKQQLIDALNQLTELKKLEADRQLGLVK